MRIAIVGAGVTGLSAAYALAPNHDVTLYNEIKRPGGHSHTVTLDLPEGPVSVDCGFIVFNRKNYPHFSRLLDALGVTTQRSDMTFSTSIDDGSLEFKGGQGLNCLFAQRRNLVRPRFFGLIRAIMRFHHVATQAFLSPEPLPDTLAQFLSLHRLDTTSLARDYLYPMMAAIWSGATSHMGAMPTRTFLQFFHNHGLLSIDGKPLWETVTGGSHTYVRALLDSLTLTRRFGTSVQRLERHENHVVVVDHNGCGQVFDEVILAIHSDQALTLLGGEASLQERTILSAIPYASNRAYLHKDPALMPRTKRAWASWNYLRAGVNQQEENRPVSLTYWMNNLQNLATLTPVFLTLNPNTPPRSNSVWREFTFDHPQFGTESRTAQAALHTIQGRQRVWFAGAWCGYGFHEDGCQAGLAIAEALGSSVSWAREVVPVSSAHNCIERTAYFRRLYNEKTASKC